MRGYCSKNLLSKIIEIQEIALDEQKKGYMNQREVYDRLIAPNYHISIRTYYNYLARNAKKELADLENGFSSNMREIATKVYVDEHLSIKEAAIKLGITPYKMREVIRRYDLKSKRHEAILARDKHITQSKEQKKIERCLRIIEIQEESANYKKKAASWIHREVIRPKYGISLPTYSKYMKVPATEELEAIRERDRLRDIANRNRKEMIS